eukprot:817924-Prymnesium_polylepis.1
MRPTACAWSRLRPSTVARSAAGSAPSMSATLPKRGGARSTSSCSSREASAGGWHAAGCCGCGCCGGGGCASGG